MYIHRVNNQLPFEGPRHFHFVWLRNFMAGWSIITISNEAILGKSKQWNLKSVNFLKSNVTSNSWCNFRFFVIHDPIKVKQISKGKGTFFWLGGVYPGTNPTRPNWLSTNCSWFNSETSWPLRLGVCLIAVCIFWCRGYLFSQMGVVNKKPSNMSGATASLPLAIPLAIPSASSSSSDGSVAWQRKNRSFRKHEYILILVEQQFVNNK